MPLFKAGAHDELFISKSYKSYRIAGFKVAVAFFKEALVFVLEYLPPSLVLALGRKYKEPLFFLELGQGEVFKLACDFFDSLQLFGGYVLVVVYKYCGPVHSSPSEGLRS